MIDDEAAGTGWTITIEGVEEFGAFWPGTLTVHELD
jgi:hypothetical protein